MATWGRENVADCSESAGSTIGHDATLSLAALKRAYNAESEWAAERNKPVVSAISKATRMLCCLGRRPGCSAT